MTSSPQPLPSLPPSPDPDSGPAPLPSPKGEDIAHVWHDDEPLSKGQKKHANSKRASRKGKERAVSSDTDEEEEDAEAAAAGYPPTKEEEAESRRIQENLRRWEIAERQRRKVARESASAAARTAGNATTTSNAPSLFADLFRRDSRKAPLGGVGAHHVISTTDEAVPLDELDAPVPIERPSPSPSPTPELENPFETPSASRTSLNIPDHSAIMTESDSIPDEIARANGHLNVPQRPTIQASSSFASPGQPQTQTQKKKRQPPPPQPLDLPAPRAPPPLGDGPNMSRPPEPISPPSTSRAASSEMERETQQEQRQGPTKAVEEDLPPVRWWHEFLCGCGEGADRGGDYQAGRTNPME